MAAACGSLGPALPYPQVEKADFSIRTALGILRGEQRFGQLEWETYFGVIGEAPPLPDNIDEILNSQCPFSQRLVKQTHMLVLIPATVRGQDLTLNCLAELIKHPLNGGHAARYDDFYFHTPAHKECGEEKVKQSYWVLMARDVIPGSRDLLPEKQRDVMRQYTHQGFVPPRQGYHMPSPLEAAVCILMEHVISGHRLFGTYPSTYTYCRETSLGQSPVVVGGFNEEGLSIYSPFHSVEPAYGLAPLRRFISPHQVTFDVMQDD